MVACDVCVEPGQTDNDIVSQPFLCFELHPDSLQDRSLFVPIADAILPAYVLMYCE